MPRRFRPGVVPTLATAVAVALLSGLGVWQVRRYYWKQGLLAERRARIAEPPAPLSEILAAPEASAWRRTRLRGRYDTTRTILLMHRSRGLHSGAEVLTPFLPADAEPGAPALLVDRGWIPERDVAHFVGADRPPDPVELTALVRPMNFGSASPSPGATPRREWNRFEPAALQAALPYRLAPVLLQRGDVDDGRPPIGHYDTPRSQVDHVTYAITWFGTAAIALATWVGVGLRGGEDDRPVPPAPPRGG